MRTYISWDIQFPGIKVASKYSKIHNSKKKVTDYIEFSIPSIAEVFGPSESSDVAVLE